MEIKCSICGKKAEISKAHKDYRRLANDSRETYVCRQCSSKIQFQAKQAQEPPKPI